MPARTQPAHRRSGRRSGSTPALARRAASCGTGSCRSEQDRSCGEVLLEESALVKMQRAAGIPGGRRIMRDHDDGLAEVTIENLQRGQNLVRRRAVEVAGRLVAEQELRV